MKLLQCFILATLLSSIYSCSSIIDQPKVGILCPNSSSVALLSSIDSCSQHIQYLDCQNGTIYNVSVDSNYYITNVNNKWDNMTADKLDALIKSGIQSGSKTDFWSSTIVLLTATLAMFILGFIVGNINVTNDNSRYEEMYDKLKLKDMRW